MTLDEHDQYRINPDQLPKQIDLDLPPELIRRLSSLAAVSGRSVDEVILEILDQGLQDHAQS